MESLCYDIRIAMSAVPDVDSVTEAPENQSKWLPNLSLDSLILGDVIAKGCNAIVHAAKWATKQIDEVASRRERNNSENSDDSGTELEVLSANEEDDFTVNSFNGNQNPFPPPSTPEDRSKIETLCKPFNGYDLAVKMMFNYEAESNAPAIMQAMHKEVVPSRTPANLLDDHWEKGNRQRKKYLPPHPNIVELDYTFADSVPHLPQAMSLYPDALPRRLNRNGSGRNMTLFLIMKRYNCSLQEYLKAYEPSPRTRLMLIAQLLEAIVHLVMNGVAHRDLKNDNILLDLSEGPDYPRLVITDFGCCLADEGLGLQLPYYTAETSRGGNSALMAPEVACAQPGRFTVIDYSKADLWAAGTLAYEILGHPNPFHHGRSTKLDSRIYQESDLKVPKEDSNNPVIWKLIHSILQRNPRKRPDVNVAADICAMLLFAPVRWFSGRYVDERMVIKWLVSFAAKTLVEHRKSSSDVERQLSATFLKRVTLQDIMTAVEFLQHK